MSSVLQSSFAFFRSLPAFTFAFQPIVSFADTSVVAYEALARGLDGSPYPTLTKNMNPALLRRFNHEVAVRAVKVAQESGFGELDASLTINLPPDVGMDGRTAETIQAAAMQAGIEPCRIVIELTEDHKLSLPQLRQVLERNREAGFLTAVDDFGAGYAGLTMLVECQPELLKLDKVLIRGIDHDRMRRNLVEAFVRVCNSLEIVLIAEGVETRQEADLLSALGVNLMQGYYFGRPAIETFANSLSYTCGKRAALKASLAQAMSVA